MNAGTIPNVSSALLPMSDAANLIKPIGRANLTREVVNAFTRLIMERAWEPGDAIPTEKELATRFGVGRSTIREALQSLVIMGVLEIRHGEGTFVREPTSDLLADAFLWGLLLSPRSVGDFTEFRVCVEANCAAKAARSRSQETVDQLYHLLDKMKSTVGHGDEDSVKQYDNRFHIAIAEATGNPIFVNVVTVLQSTVRLWFPITSPLTGTADDTLAEHKAIADAISAQDEEAARVAMRTHLTNAAKRLTLLLEQRAKAKSG